MPSITIDKEFFRKSLDDYNDWRLAQPRELLQNSIDAGSTRINFAVTENADGHVVLVCGNDGPPMTEDILVGKFMALGGTTKGASEGSVGGFGIAKLVIACAHQKYEIHTGDLLLTGEGGQYELNTCEYLNGTRTSVVLWDDYSTTIDSVVAKIKQVVVSSDVKAVVTINGVEYTNRLVVGGDALERFDFGNCYLVDDSKLSDSLIVRVNGLFMFSMWVKTRKAVILELTDSKKLTSNRDGLSWSCRSEVEKYITDLAINNETNLKVRVPEITQYGDFDVAHAFEELDALVASIENNLKDAGNPDNGFSPEATDSHTTPTPESSDTDGAAADSQVLPGVVDVLEFGNPSTRPMATPAPAGAVATGTIELQNRVQVEGSPQVAAYGSGVSSAEPTATKPVKPAKPKRKMAKVVVVNETKVQLPDYCVPGGLSKHMRKTVADWAGICLASASLLKIERRFSIGYVISDTSEALWMHTTGGDTILFNPFDIVKVGNASWTLKNKPSMTVEDMVPLAIHEITHMQLRSKYHDEEYAGRLTDNMGKAYRNKKAIEKRAKEISKVMFENFIW